MPFSKESVSFSDRSVESYILTSNSDTNVPFLVIIVCFTGSQIILFQGAFETFVSITENLVTIAWIESLDLIAILEIAEM